MADGLLPELGACLEALAERFGEALRTGHAICNQHASGEGPAASRPPDAVLFPTSVRDVSDGVQICAAHRVAIIPYGAGTSLEGHVHALRGGVTFDMSLMDRILAVNASDLDVHVEAGVTREALNGHLRDSGLFFPLDPGANATLGGMAATRASGTNAVRYGTMKDVTLGLTVVTPQGVVIETGGRARKSSMGYDLTRLYVGSEGTLGVITSLHLRLFGIPEVIAAGVAQFQSAGEAILAVIAVLQMGVPVARLEFLDEVQMGACIRWSKLTELLAKPTLFVELHGSAVSVADQQDQIRDVFASSDCANIQWALRTEDRSRLWTARHNAYWAAKSLCPGYDAVTTDACVPISDLADTIAEVKTLAAHSGFVCPIVGHVGDGNFHVMILHDAQSREAADRLGCDIARVAIRRGGTASGEHGVGSCRKTLLREEHATAVQTMLQIKSQLDPMGIMNPDKIF
ncbi:FAD-binding oxidoreductase [Novosphingobium sp. Gsoil 351]|uniref:FAD-binding oxidoreductase n=1 Tax=Novosphingobium sp. Gsoil 351 TaxID=2675225 RepID=UPI0012B456C7|nr:FAD-linked oxidase C-terminal domain-containing protein [Novosphingobium sp. Gsoil 351]QGN55479.1 FAD-binding protein [Novosphingobium sp. Gsoil 351]